MTSSSSERPLLTPEVTGAELQRWYWLKEELTQFARTLGIRATGSKGLLTRRIAAYLNGRIFTEPTVARPAPSQQLSGTLAGDTMIPAGQRCSQVVRGWFIEQLGPSFRFDKAMRDFFARTDGTQTLVDALDHWHATRNIQQQEPDAQFEYNRFTQSWHKQHPNGARQELLAAWREYRNRPIDERGRA